MRLIVVGALLLGTGCGGAQSGSSSPEPDIAGDEARMLVVEGAVLLDVTPRDRSDRSEIAGRTHIPLPELAERMDELPRDRTIVVYCLGGRGSPRAARLLRDEGFEVRLLGARSRWGD